MRTRASNDREATSGGGLGPFLLGVVLASAGGYMVAKRATVGSDLWRPWGQSPFGLSMLPFLFGLGLAAAGRTVVGLTLVAAGLAVILSSVIMGLHLWFAPTTLYDALVMFGMLAAGLGLLARSFVSFARHGA